MTASRARSLPWANSTLMARKINYDLERSRLRSVIMTLTWAYTLGARDGNRTRIISLGNGEVPARSEPDLHAEAIPVSVRV